MSLERYSWDLYTLIVDVSTLIVELYPLLQLMCLHGYIWGLHTFTFEISTLL